MIDDMFALYAVLAYTAGIPAGLVIAKLTETKIKLQAALICACCSLSFLIAFKYGWGETFTELINCFITVFFMLWLACTDIKGFVLPNKILLVWLLCRIPLIILTGMIEWSLLVPMYSLIGAVVIFILFLIMYYASRRTLGGGDVKLSFVLGLSLTLINIFNAVFYGLVLCAVFAGIGLATKKLNKKDFLPLGPFLFAGTLIAYLI